MDMTPMRQASDTIPPRKNEHPPTNDNNNTTSPYFATVPRLCRHFCVTTYFPEQPLIKHLQGSDEWFRARSHLHLTASTIAGVVGLNPYDKAMACYSKALLKSEQLFAVDSYRAITWGKENEGLARQFLRDEFLMEIREVGTFIYDRDKRFGATPDGLVVDGILHHKLTNLEIKAPYAQRLPNTGIAPMYLLQTYGEMAATGIDNTLLFYWTPYSFALWYIEFDATIWDTILYPALKLLMDAMDELPRGSAQGLAGRDTQQHMTRVLEQVDLKRQGLSSEMLARMRRKVYRICEFSDREFPSKRVKEVNARLSQQGEPLIMEQDQRRLIWYQRWRLRLGKQVHLQDAKDTIYKDEHHSERYDALVYNPAVVDLLPQQQSLSQGGGDPALETLDTTSCSSTNGGESNPSRRIQVQVTLPIIVMEEEEEEEQDSRMLNESVSAIPCTVVGTESSTESRTKPGLTPEETRRASSVQSQFNHLQRIQLKQHRQRQRRKTMDKQQQVRNDMLLIALTKGGRLHK